MSRVLTFGHLLVEDILLPDGLVVPDMLGGDAIYAAINPAIGLGIPSIVDAELTPKGAHVASIYTHYAPFALRGTDWRLAKEMLLANTLDTLETYAPGIRSLVVAADVKTPQDLQAEVGLTGGHMFHGELTLDQLFTMRPLLGHAGYGSTIRGLHLCGAGTHPGGFMTGTSGKLAAQVLSRRVN